jgi:hypothetical protein
MNINASGTPPVLANNPETVLIKDRVLLLVLDKLQQIIPPAQPEISIDAKESFIDSRKAAAYSP